jgi:hypothetical protein
MTRFFPRILQRCAQAASLAAVAALIGFFSMAPAYTHLAPGRAMIKLTFTHGAPRVTDCRRLSVEELEKLPPNMRRPTECPRRRPPVWVEFTLDTQTMLTAWLPPSGLSGDGPSRMYRGFAVPAGSHRLTVRLRDSGRTSGFDYEFDQTVNLEASKNLVIDFHPTGGGFYIR